jgi:hypothetical protein
MPAPELPDLDELALRLVRLRHRAQDLARLIERAEERHMAFPNDHSLRTLEELRGQRDALQADIVKVEEQLRPLMRRPEPG